MRADDFRMKRISCKRLQLHVIEFSACTLGSVLTFLLLFTGKRVGRIVEEPSANRQHHSSLRRDLQGSSVVMDSQLLHCNSNKSILPLMYRSRAIPKTLQ